MLIVCLFAFSGTTRIKGLLTQTSKEWGFTPAYGMLITGQPEEALSRSIGTLHPSLPISVDLGQGLASGMDQSALANVPPIHQLTGGPLQYTVSWAMPNWVGCSGLETTTWFMTTAVILKDSMVWCLWNVLNHNYDRGLLIQAIKGTRICTLHHIFFLPIHSWKNKFLSDLIFNIFDSVAFYINWKSEISNCLNKVHCDLFNWLDWMHFLCEPNL